MVIPKAKTKDIKDDIEEKVHDKADFMGKNNIEQGNVNQEPLAWLAKRLNSQWI